MKLAFYELTAASSVGGVQTAVWELSNELASRGIEVHVISGDGPIRPGRLHPGVKVTTFPFIRRDRVPDLGSRFQKIVERLSLTIRARKALRDGSFDVVFLTKPFDFFAPLLAGKGRSRYALISQGTDFFPMDRRLARRIDHWLSCSHFNAWQVMSHYKLPVKVIYNGVDTSAFRPMPPDEALRKAIGIKEGETVFIFAGRLVGWKGMEYAVRAMSEPAVRGLNARLVIVGDGPERARLKELAERTGAAARVSFVDFVGHKDLPRYYSVAHAAVFPSVGDEAFGISIAEAMACGKPVIGSYIGGIPEVIGNDGSSGFLVAARDSVEIAGRMALLASDPALAESMGQAARQRVEENYTWKRSADRLLKAIGAG